MFNQISKYISVIPSRAVSLFILLERYVNAAELQIQRIERVQKCSKNNRLANRSIVKKGLIRNSHNNKLFADIHFYFISVSHISKILSTLDGELNNANIKKIKNGFNSIFKQEIRGDLEHINERAVGKKNRNTHPNANKLKADFLNFSNNMLTLGEKKYEVSRKKLKIIKNSFKKVISVIHNDYALQDKYFVKHLKNKIRFRKLIRRANKLSRLSLKTKKK